MTTTKSLVTVKCINRKMAGQIRYVPYDWNEDSLYRRIYTTLIGQFAGAVLGWVPIKFIDPENPGIITPRAWLVKIGPDLYWWTPPSKGPIVETYGGPTLEQLFVD